MEWADVPSQYYRSRRRLASSWSMSETWLPCSSSAVSPPVFSHCLWHSLNSFHRQHREFKGLAKPAFEFPRVLSERGIEWGRRSCLWLFQESANVVVFFIRRQDGSGGPYFDSWWHRVCELLFEGKWRSARRGCRFPGPHFFPYLMFHWNTGEEFEFISCQLLLSFSV